MLRPMTIGAVLGVALAVGLVTVLSSRSQPVPSSDGRSATVDAGVNAPRSALPTINRPHPMKALPLPDGTLDGVVPARPDPATLVGTPETHDGGPR